MEELLLTVIVCMRPAVRLHSLKRDIYCMI